MQSHWDPCLATLEKQDTRDVSVLAIPASDRFISLMSRGEIKIWDAKTTSCIATHKGVLPSSVRLSSDGTELLYISGHEVLQIMDAATRNCIAEFRGHTDEIICAMFSADGQQFASASKDGTLRIWDRAFNKPVATYDYNHGDQMLGFSPDGLAFLMISDHNIIRLLSSRGGHILTISNHKDHVKAAIFSPDSQKLVSVDMSGTIRFLDILSGTSLVANGAITTTDRGLLFFSDSVRLISPMKGSVEKGHAIGIWNTLEATCDYLLEGHRAAISDIILSSDERRIASASYDKSIRVWDTHMMSCTGIYNGHDNSITSLTYSANDTLLISADSDGTLKVWDTTIETQWAKIESHESAVLEVVFSPNKERVITTSGDRTLRLWDTVTGKCISMGTDHRLFVWVPLMVPLDIPSAPFDHVMSIHGLFGWSRTVEFSPDGSAFLSSGLGWEASSLKLWSTTTGDCQLLLHEAMSSVLSIAFSPDGTTITSTSMDGTLRYWDTATQKLLDSFNGGTYGISSSSYSPDGTQLIFACDDGAVRLFHLSTRDCKEMDEAHEYPALLATMSANGSKLASSSKSRVKIWETDTLRCIANHSTLSDVRQILFSPDGQYLVVLYETGEVKMQILSAATGHCVDQLLGICGLANHMAFDPAAEFSLITNVGTLAFDPPDSTVACVHAEPSFSSRRVVSMIGLGLSRDGEWITWNSCNMLWLPPTVRISASDIAASTIALGSRLGRLLLIGIDPSAVPNLP